MQSNDLVPDLFLQDASTQSGEVSLPAWSNEISDLVLEMAAARQRSLDQMQLQKIVYIAHGWRLAFTGEPLTGDRPEATAVGPTYRRIVTHYRAQGTTKIAGPLRATNEVRSILDPSEMELISKVSEKLADLESFQLSAVTRHPDSAWARTYGDGSGDGKDIPHHLVRGQFERLAMSGT